MALSRSTLGTPWKASTTPTAPAARAVRPTIRAGVAHLGYPVREFLRTGEPSSVGLGVRRRGRRFPAVGGEGLNLAIELIEVLAQESGQATQLSDDTVQLVEIDGELGAHGRSRLEIRVALLESAER